MKCMHCRVEFHDQVEYHSLGADGEGFWTVEEHLCPACGKKNLFLINADAESIEHAPINIKQKMAILPRGGGHPMCPVEVPAEIAGLYQEACLVLPYSPRASAALSRMAIRGVLRLAGGVKVNDAASEIREVLDEHKLPPYLEELLAAIFFVGDYAAYPLKGRLPDVIQPVEPAEAELNLEICDGLFEFYFVQPANSLARRAAVNTVLEAHGKPLI